MDDMTAEQRHAVMQKIRSKDTRPELALRKSLWHKGVRYRKNDKDLPGKPDIAITKHKIAIFIDGEYFHGKDWRQGGKDKALAGTNPEYWVQKIESNMQRDEAVNIQLKELGWSVFRFWSRDVLKHADEYADQILTAIKSETK